MSEAWRLVPGHEGLYEVSDQGRVRSLDRRDGRGWRLKGRLMTPSVTTYGYTRVRLWRGGHQTTWLVHRLVLTAFVGPCPEGMEGCHWNGVRSDNRVTNLRWDTPAANASDKERHGTNTRPRPVACKHGHDLTDPQNLTVAGKCRTCQRRRTREYMARKRSPELIKES